jgi:RNA-dependent RNA polymerase
MGTMDETGALPPGQFWASWQHQSGSSASPPRPLPAGTKAIVSRAPCLSPSDIRVLTAADPSTLPQSLTSQTNVVAFPRLGERPEPCLMSGGDLDGDIYFVIWNPKLIPDCVSPPLDYLAEETPEEVPDGIVRVEHIVKAFLNYMQNDQLGRIANGHLAIADAAEEFANDPDCNKLVKLHSIAVDFAKTGVPVDSWKVSELLKGVEYPDYMHGNRVSDTIIGIISRRAKQKSREKSKQEDNEMNTRRQDESERWFQIHGSEEFMNWAHEMVEEWTEEFADMMRTCLPLPLSSILLK